MAYKVSDVAQAITDARGMITHAARRLGCDRKTVYNYINKHPSVKEALLDARAGLGDRIETTLLHQALGVQDETGKYTQEPNISALIFLAKTHPAMRERGYVERSQQETVDPKSWADFIADADDSI